MSENIEQESEKKSGLSFSDALARVKNGEHMTRDFWLKQPVSMRIIKLTVIVHESLTTGTEVEDEQLALVLESDIGEVGTINNWTPNKEDLFANDWRVYGCVDTYVVADKLMAEIKLPGLPLIPIYRRESKQCFVDPDKLTPWSVELRGQQYLTSALKFGVKMDMLGLSTIDCLLESFIQDVTDCIDPNISLDKIYVDVDGIPAAVTIANHALGSFTFNTMGDYREMMVAYTGRLDVGDVKIDVDITGVFNLQFGTLEMHGRIIGTVTPNDEIVNVNLLGYSIQAYRVNMNRRSR